MSIRSEVALVLWNEDLIQLLSMVLLRRDLISSGIEPSQGVEAIEGLIESCNATVVVFDLDPPYGRSAASLLRLLDRFHERSFVVTCADPVLALKSAPWLCGYPIFQKPYELDDLVTTISSRVGDFCTPFNSANGFCQSGKYLQGIQESLESGMMSSCLFQAH